MADLQAYLAAKYMSGAKADAILDRAEDQGLKRRKKKRRVEDEGSVASGSGTRRAGGLVIQDDDGGWAKEVVEEDSLAAPVVDQRNGQFKPKSANSWATVRPSDPSLARTPSPEPVDEDPYVVSTTVETAPAPSRGGLQSAADLRAENQRREAAQKVKKAESDKEQREKRAKFIRDGGEEGDEGDPNETVYRDSSGRKIDTKREKAEAAKRKREELEQEMKKMEWGKGLVQREDKEKKKREQEAMAFKPIARYADDEDMNNEMKDVDRWNDPAANFLTTKKKSASSAPRMPRYQGPSPAPNRFGIPPGYRWDGVDRGNGFEKIYSQRGNELKMRKQEAHNFNVEEM